MATITLTATGRHKHGGTIYSYAGATIGVVARTYREDKPYLCNVWETGNVTYHATRKAAKEHLANSVR